MKRLKHFTIFAQDQIKDCPLEFKVNCVGQQLFLDCPATLPRVREVAASLLVCFRCVSVFVGKDIGKLYWTNYGSGKQALDKL